MAANEMTGKRLGCCRSKLCKKGLINEFAFICMQPLQIIAVEKIQVVTDIRGYCITNIQICSTDGGTITHNHLCRIQPMKILFREMAASVPTFFNEARVTQLLEGQWLPLINAMHQALLAAASKDVVQRPRSITPVKDRGLLISMPGYVDVNNGDEGEAVLACKLVTLFEGNSKKKPPMPSIMGTICLFDVLTGKLSCILEATEITEKRTAAASVAATNILYNKRHGKTYEDAITLCILGAGAQGKSHAQAFHAAFKNITEIRIWNHRLPKAERLVAELKTLGVHQAVVVSTAQECAKGADVLVTATTSDAPVLYGEWVKDGAHVNAIGAGQHHHSELDLPLYQKAKIYLDDEAGGRNELRGLEDMGIPLIAPVGDIILQPDLMPGKQEVTVFHSCGMAAEDALAAQLVYKQHLRSQLQN